MLSISTNPKLFRPTTIIEKIKIKILDKNLILIKYLPYKFIGKLL
jgi:hypothetical protein